MIWPAIRAVVFGVLTVAEAISDTYDGAKRIGRALLPRRREDAFPLTYKDVAHQQEQIRSATRPQRATCRCGATHYRLSTNDCERCRPGI